MCLFLDSLFYSIVLSVYVALCQRHTVMITATSQKTLKSGMVSPQSLFFFKTILATLGLSHFHIHFRISFNYLKTFWNFDRDFIESIGQFGNNYHLNTIESSNL